MELRKGQLFDQRYQLISNLGHGASAQVWLACDTMANNLKVAIKVFSSYKGMDTMGIQNFKREFTFVYNIQHQNLLTPSNYAICDKVPYLVLPYCENGSSVSMIGRADEKDVIKFLHDVSAALECLHSHNIVHQDIKPDNVLLDDDCNFLVTDFGISVQSVGDDASSYGSYGGTKAYMGPERFEKGATPIKLNDIWALGATAYELIAGNAPFGDNGGLVQVQGEEIPDLPETVSPEVRQIILSCLEPEPWNRPSAEAIRKKTQLFLETGSWKEKDGKMYLYGSIAAAILVLLVAGLWIWDYNRTKVFYYKDYVEYWGVPEGIGRLSGSDMEHREQSYRFEYCQRKLRRASLVNSRDKVINHSDTEHAISRYSDVYFYYTDNGKIDYKLIYDSNGKVLFKMDYDENLKTVTFRQNDEYGTEMNLKANTTKLYNETGAWFEDKSRISRYILKYDDKGLLVEQQYVGLQNVPVNDSENIHGMRFKYDEKGHKIEEQFIDLDGNITTNGIGLAVKCYAYDEDDNWHSVTYLNAERKSSHDGNNCAYVEMSYDEYGNRKTEKYYTIDKKPSIRTDVNTFGFSYQYDEQGFRTEQTSLDGNGQPMVNIYGYVTSRDSCNADGFIVKRVFLDADGSPATYTSDGESYGILMLTMNEHGQPLTQAEYDEFGNPVENTGGVHMIKMTYDSLGNQTSVRNFSQDLKPTSFKGFHHEAKIQYDEFGNLTNIAYYDTKGKLTVNEDGVSEYCATYNRQGAVTKVYSKGTKGELVLGADMTAGITNEYDERGNRVLTQYFDVAEKPCMSNYGYSSKRYVYDEKTNFCVSEKAYDAEGKLIEDLQKQYDNRGNVVKSYTLNAGGSLKAKSAVLYNKYDINNHCVESYYCDLKGNKVNKPGYSYSVTKNVYDERGNAIETTYWSVSGKPAQDEQYTFKRIHEYDGMNRVIYEKNLDATGKPLSGANANPEGKVVYDNYGNRAEIYCYDGYGKPRLSSDGYFAMKSKYNNRNQQVSVEYYDTSNRHVNSKSNGYARAEFVYDKKGNRTHENYYDASGRCFRKDENVYNGKNRMTEYRILDGNNKATDQFTGFSKVIIAYDKSEVIPSVRKYYTSSGKLLATQQYNAKKREWMGAQMIVDWRDNVIKANRECPVTIEDGLIIYRFSYSGNTVYVTLKMTKVSASDIDEDKKPQLRQYVARMKYPMKSLLKLPASVSIEINIVDKYNETI